MSDTDSDYSSDEEEIDIHAICLEGTDQDVDWALSKDRLRMLNTKEEKTGRMPLHVTAFAGMMDRCVLLIKRGAHVDAKDGIAASPLMLAAESGCTEVCRMLLECGANIKMKDNYGWTCLHHAVSQAHINCCIMLIKRGVNLSAEEFKNGKTALHLCAEQGLDELADALIVRGADMYASGDSIYSKTPLHLACQVGHHEVAKVLLNRGADMEAMSGFLDKTPLHLACEKGHIKCVRALVEHGADMGAVGFNVNGNTPLHLAAQNGHSEVCKYLISKGASMQTQGMWTVQGTPAHTAVQYGHLGCIQAFLDSGADMEQKDRNGLTIMHTACHNKKYDIAFALIDKGANLMAEANNGRYPIEFVPFEDSHLKEKLRLAGVRYDLEMERLAKLAAEKIAAEKEAAKQRQLVAEEEARLAAIRLAQKQQREARFCSLLLAACNVSGELSALTDLSIEFSDLDINIELDSTLGAHAITRAAFNGFNVIVAALLKWDGINVDVQEKDGNTALHMAASRAKPQHKSIVEMLLLNNARIGIANNAGKTPACVAHTTYLSEIIRNPRLIQTRTQMEVMSMSPQMNNNRDKRAKAMGNAMAVATGGANNLISLMSSTKIGTNNTTVYSPAMMDPATILLADAYGQNYSPGKPLEDTWKTSHGGNGGHYEKGAAAGVFGNQSINGAYGGVNSNNINRTEVGRNDFHFFDPNESDYAGPQPMTNEYGNIYLPPKMKTHQEVNYQRDLRGFNTSSSNVKVMNYDEDPTKVSYGDALQYGISYTGGVGPGIGLQPHTSMSSMETGAIGTVGTFHPSQLDNSLYPDGFGDPLAKSISQYTLRDADPGYIYSHTHFNETHKIPPMVEENELKNRAKIDNDTEAFTRGQFGPVPTSFRGCTEDMFFTVFLEDEDEDDREFGEDQGKGKRARDLVSSRLIKILNEQGVDYDGEEIDALVNDTYHATKDETRTERVAHIKFELGKIRHMRDHLKVPAQSSHPPTAFDTTAEWITTRDYLWLLGQPYSKNQSSKKDKRVILRGISKVMDEIHRIFTDPESLETYQTDPLADSINNVNNYGRSDTGKVRLLGGKVENLGDIAPNSTRARFLQASSEEKMREIGLEGILTKSGQGAHALESHAHASQAIVSSDSKNIFMDNSVSSGEIPGFGINNSNLQGGNAFKYVDTAPPLTTDVTSPGKPIPPINVDRNQFIFANQKVPTPANELIVPIPKTRAEGADIRIRQLCVKFVGVCLDIFEPSNGWPLPTGTETNSECAMLSKRLTMMFGPGSNNPNKEAMSEDLYLSLVKLLDLAATDTGRDFGSLGSGSILPGGKGNSALAFPPRRRRVLVDCMYDIAFALKTRAESDFPVDSIRAHLWANSGRKQLQRHKEKDEEETPLTLWLLDLHLIGVSKAFKQLGFKEMEDFTDFSLADVQEYFPFLKLGDAIRMSRNIKLFTPKLLESYKRRASGGDISVPVLPPIPNLPPSSPRTSNINNNCIGKTGPTPSRRVKAPVVVPVVREKKKKLVTLDREPTREEYLSGVPISDYYFKKLQQYISEQTDGVNARVMTDIEFANAHIREKGLVKQILAKETDEGNIIIIRSNDIDDAIADLQAQITKATAGFQFRWKSDIQVANEIVREAGLLGLVVCHEDEKGDIIVIKLNDIKSAIDVLQEQITRETKGFNLRVNSDLAHANELIRQAGMYGIVVAREDENGDIIMEQLHEDGSLWELFVNTISIIDTVDLGTAMDGQDPSVKIWLGDEEIGKTSRSKDAGNNASYSDTFHMNFGKKTYKSDHCAITAEVYNESVIGGLEHVGKGSLDLKTLLPEEKFGDYITVTIPLWYTCPGEEDGNDDGKSDKNNNKKPPVSLVDNITDIDFDNFQQQVLKETQGFNFRISSDRTHAKKMIKERGLQRLIMAAEDEKGDIRLRRIDKPLGQVVMRVMIKAEK
jgi:ankyrin repeat protein